MGKSSFDSCWASIYKNLAYYQGTLSILDMILFFVRIGLGINMTGSSTTATTSSSNQNHIQTGIALDVIGSVTLCMIGICALVLSCCRSTAQCCEYCRWLTWDRRSFDLMHVLVSLLYQVERRIKTAGAIVAIRWLTVVHDPSTRVEPSNASSCSIAIAHATRPDRIFDFAFASSFFSSSLLFEPRLLLSMPYQDPQQLLSRLSVLRE